MSSDQHYTAFLPPRNAQKPQTPEWLYDEVMRHIEPDLMLSAIDGLSKKYRGETPEQRRVRMDDYLRAFAAFDEMAAELGQMFLTEVTTVRHTAEEAARREEEKDHAESLRKITDDLDHADSSPA